jgi:hypothetical protein
MKRLRNLFSLSIAATLFSTMTLLSPAQHTAQQHQQMSQPECQSGETAADQKPGKTVYGEPKPLGNGTVRSWVRLDQSGKPSAIGLTMTEAALTGLPTELPTEGEMWYEYSLALPQSAPVAPFKHIGLNWNPKGHPPQHIYDTGHFDFHFYMISEKERLAITAQGEDLKVCRKQPAPEFVPASYFYGPDSEHPRMGAHWIDKEAHEFHGHQFTATLIYGSYDGRVIFIEPMITKAYLESKPCLTQSIKQPAKYQQSGFYPTNYSARYDAVRKEYSVALEGLTER